MEWSRPGIYPNTVSFDVDGYLAQDDHRCEVCFEALKPSEKENRVVHLKTTHPHQTCPKPFNFHRRCLIELMVNNCQQVSQTPEQLALYKRELENGFSLRLQNLWSADKRDFISVKYRSTEFNLAELIPNDSENGLYSRVYWKNVQDVIGYVHRLPPDERRLYSTVMRYFPFALFLCAAVPTGIMMTLHNRANEWVGYCPDVGESGWGMWNDRTCTESDALFGLSQRWVNLIGYSASLGLAHVNCTLLNKVLSFAFEVGLSEDALERLEPHKTLGLDKPVPMYLVSTPRAWMMHLGVWATALAFKAMSMNNEVGRGERDASLITLIQMLGLGMMSLFCFSQSLSKKLPWPTLVTSQDLAGMNRNPLVKTLDEMSPKMFKVGIPLEKERYEFPIGEG